MPNWIQQLQETYSHMVHSRLLNEGQSLNVGAPGSGRPLNADMARPFVAVPSQPNPFPSQSYSILNTGLPGEGERMPGGSIRPYDPNKETREDFLKRMGDSAHANRARASEASSDIDEIDRKEEIAVDAGLLPLSMWNTSPLAKAAPEISTGLKNLNKISDKIKDLGNKVQVPGDKIKNLGDKIQVSGDKIKDLGNKVQVPGDKVQVSNSLNLRDLIKP